MAKAAEEGSLFRAEEAVIAAARERLRAGPGEGDDRAAFADLLRAYEKLYRTTLRLLRHADRSEAELNRLALRLKETNAALGHQNQALETLSAKLSKYLSPQLYKSIFSGTQSATITAARKQLTVFFADIVDFTSLAETLEPEEVTTLLNGYLTEMARIAQSHGATIDKYIGDAIMIFFGDPESQGPKEDALRCLAMATEMQRRLIELRTEWDGRGQTYPIQVRMGVTTGFCTVGNFGSEDRLDYTICGTPVNLAHRLQRHADPDSILVTEATFSLIDGSFPAVEAGTIQMKGIARPVKTFRILCDGESDQRYLQHRDDGLNLFLDLDRLDRAAALRALEALERIKERLSQRFDGAGPGPAGP